MEAVGWGSQREQGRRKENLLGVSMFKVYYKCI
jgi:hypothetical protein